MNNRLKIFDIWVDPVDMAQALDCVTEFVENGKRPHSVFAVNPEKNFSVPKNPLLYETFRTADLLIPDGASIVVAARFLYGASLSRVPGVELMDKICELALKKGYGIFIYGAKEEVNKKAADILRDRYQGLQIVGRSDGYVKEEDMAYLVDKINTSNADILFLALGSPKQEKWFSTYKDQLKTVKVCQGIGGTLDVVAGIAKRAPKIWRKLWAEWLYRLIIEPKRIKRQKVLPLFAMMIIFAKLKQIFGIREGN